MGDYLCSVASQYTLSSDMYYTLNVQDNKKNVARYGLWYAKKYINMKNRH